MFFRAPTCKLTTGLLLLALGVLTIIWTPLELFMNERLRMMPGLPAFEWWQRPPDTVYLRIYIFNITNAEEFLSGQDAKLRMEEIGPFVFMERWSHNNVVFNDNSTMSYTVNHTAIYLPEKNTIDLNATLVVPNLSALIGASYLWNSPFITKMFFNYAMSSMSVSPIKTTTAYSYIFNSTDRFVEVGNTFLPSVIPIKNVGVINMIYNNFADRVNAYIGSKHGHERFSLIEKYAGSSNVPGQGDSCGDNVVNASEGVMFNQRVTKHTMIKYFRKTLCRVTPIFYNREIEKDGIKAYEFVFPNTSYDRKVPLKDDCYRGSPVLPNGLSDLSKCYFSFPFAVSFPHFLYGDPKLRTYVDGLRPNTSLHRSYVYVEPLSGIPLESRARSQSNLVIRPLRGFHEMFDRFSDMAIPMFWIEYAMEDLPYYVYYLVYFTAVILPNFQWMLTAMLLILGIFFSYLSVRSCATRKKYKIRRGGPEEQDKTQTGLEQELFVKK